MLKKSNENFTQTQLLNVQQAADYLGVHEGTIRRWAYAKRLKGSKMGERGDWRFTEEELMKILHVNLSGESSDTAAVAADWAKIEDGTHTVQFYEEDTFLIKVISEFINSGDTAVVVANQPHKQKLEKGLRLYGLDVATARKEGLYAFYDAADTLAKFMVKGMPDSDLFFEVIGGVITKAARNKKKKVRIFGEMVAILWADGNKEAAIRLEELWNEIQEIHAFSLFCAYPIHGFGEKDDASSFLRIEKTHSHVIPSESYSSLVQENEKLREIALLQQKAQALEAEIAKRKEAEVSLLHTLKELKMSEEFNRNIVESSADCIKVLDLQGRLLSFNGPGCKALEIDDVTEYIGKEWFSFWEGEYNAEAKRAFENAKNGEAGRFQGFCPTTKGTPKWWDVVVTPLTYDNGKVQKMVAVSRDITAQKELEQRKEDFLSATSHELKTPLTSQKVFVQLLQKEIEKNKDSTYVHFTTKINEQTDKLTKLVTDLLDVSKVQGGKLVLNFAPFNMNECIRAAVDEMHAIAKKHKIVIKGKIVGDVKGDKERISQVVINLLTNAVKYSPKADKIIVSLKKDKNVVLVSVQDFGIGIDKNELENVFDRFYRVSDIDEKTYPGLGMGLYIASEIVKLHGGKIWVDSTKGKGSTFSFTMPLD